MSQKLYEYVAILNIKGKMGEINPVVAWDKENVVLIDTGMPMQFELFKNELAEIGFAPHQITHILFTHQDIDRIGCAKQFLEISPDIETVAHVEEAPYINGQKTPLKLAAMEANLESLSKERRAFYEMLKPGFANSYVKITKIVQDGDILPVCGGIQVVLTSGHTLGHTCYFLMTSKILVGGDAVTAVNGVLQGPNPIHAYDYQKAQESLQKLLPLNIEAIVAYHGGKVEGNIHEKIKINFAGSANKVKIIA